MSSAFAALMVDQPAQVLRPSAMPDGRADHVCGRLSARRRETGRRAAIRRAARCAGFPTCSRVLSSSVKPQAVEMAAVLLEPQRQLLVVHGLVGGGGHRDAEESPRTRHAFSRAPCRYVPMTPSRWKPSVVPSSSIANGTTAAAASVRGDADVDLVSAERHAACRGRANGSRPFLATSTSCTRESDPDPGADLDVRLDPRRIVDLRGRASGTRRRCRRRARRGDAATGSSRPGRRHEASSDPQSCSCCRAG